MAKPVLMVVHCESISDGVDMWQATAPPKPNGTIKEPRSQSAVKYRREEPDAKIGGDRLLLATADAAGSLRIWSRWPLPQQLADFSLPHSCTALAFLWPTLLLGCFSDGSLRLFDAKALRIVGRLQLAVPEDPPVAIACLGGALKLKGFIWLFAHLSTGV